MAEKTKKMQTCECKVRPDTRTVILRRNVTPAEVIVLKEVLGEHSVTDIVQKGSIERDSFEEKDILARKYNKPTKAIVEKLFPGHAPNLPMTFKEIGVEVQFAPEKKRQKGNIAPMKGKKADVPSKEEIEEISKSESSVTAVSS